MLTDHRGWPFSVTVLMWVALLVLPVGMRGEDRVQEPAQDVQRKVAKLIDQLGNDRYTTRERAQAELTKLGFAAFEALSEAQNRKNVEVAMRAKYLIRSMRIDWTWEQDSPAIKMILKGYGQQDDDQRVMRMNALAQLEAGAGVAALCRLARFERTDSLSKEAALFVIGQSCPENKEDRKRHSQVIRHTLGSSRRAGASWLHVYADWLDNSETALVSWGKLVEVERRLLQVSPDRSSQKIVRNLLRRQAEMLREMGQATEAARVSKQLFDHLELKNEVQILEIVDWLAEQKGWQLFTDLSQRGNNLFSRNALLAYRLAQAELELGNVERANQRIQKALQIGENDAKEHELTAFELKKRGLVDWAETEYRHVISLGPVASNTYIKAHFSLAEMLHDRARELDAAQTFQSLIQALQDSRDEQITADDFERQTGWIRARMHHFFALHHAARNESSQQKTHLEQALAADTSDADVLIAMYRLPNQDLDWQQRVRQLIQEAADSFRKQIAATPGDPAPYNQLAWLVGNTEGDFEEALECSQKSLELHPNQAGYLDTLARCYFAKNDLDQAVRYQSRALKLEPFSGLIRRQLERFQLEKQRRQTQRESREPINES